MYVCGQWQPCCCAQQWPQRGSNTQSYADAVPSVAVFVAMHPSHSLLYTPAGTPAPAVAPSTAVGAATPCTQRRAASSLWRDDNNILFDPRCHLVIPHPSTHGLHPKAFPCGPQQHNAPPCFMCCLYSLRPLHMRLHIPLVCVCTYTSSWWSFVSQGVAPPPHDDMVTRPQLAHELALRAACPDMCAPPADNRICSGMWVSLQASHLACAHTALLARRRCLHAAASSCCIRYTAPGVAVVVLHQLLNLLFCSTVSSSPHQQLCAHCCALYRTCLCAVSLALPRQCDVAMCVLSTCCVLCVSS